MTGQWKNRALGVVTAVSISSLAGAAAFGELDEKADVAASTMPVSLVDMTPSPLVRSPLQQADIYPEKYSFSVYRKDKKIGTHKVSFTRKGDQLKVYNDMKIRVKFLFVTAYKLDYKSTEIWQNGELQSVSADINNNGKKFTMGGGVSDDIFGWEDIYEERQSLPRGGEYFPTNHWFTKVLGKSQLLNTLTGKLIEVGIDSEGFEQITTEGEPVLAERFQYSGDLTSTAWYDEYGRWVGLQFAAKDGSFIQYRCDDCWQWGPVEPVVEAAR